jgi:hypothetical protein
MAASWYVGFEGVDRLDRYGQLAAGDSCGEVLEGCGGGIPMTGLAVTAGLERWSGPKPRRDAMRPPPAIAASII